MVKTFARAPQSVTVCYNGGRTKPVVVVLIIVYSCVVPKRTINKTKLSSYLSVLYATCVSLTPNIIPKV